MNVLFIAQCSKKALQESRRILDQFAERKGERTWQTAITAEGLATVRKLLRKTARKNTAVACHWIKQAGQTELCWIVGNLRQFNEQGSVPTNTTVSDILRCADENNWHTAEVMSIAAALGGLFHDIGKANQAFQQKLRGDSGKNYEAFRHEWVSLRLFQAFVGNAKTDEEWLHRLQQIQAGDDTENAVIAALIKDSPLLKNGENASLKYSPFRSFPPLAMLVGWLVVSHHRLPVDSHPDDRVPLDRIDNWLTGNMLKASWNATQCLKPDWTASDVKNVWTFKHGTPLRSQTWCARARYLAERALNCRDMLTHRWMQEDPLVMHLSRLALMLADHHYSAGPARPKWQDQAYRAIANTDRQTGLIKQQLDEHNVGVAHYAMRIVKSLPRLRQNMGTVGRLQSLSKRTKAPAFQWQNRAAEAAESLAQRSAAQGFFGVNMASTGCGKTFANARIMYALSSYKQGCRFSVALGLRTLTLQTGDAFREKIGLDTDDLAVLIGSDAVRQLHALRQQEKEEDKKAQTEAESPAAKSGSESAGDWYAEHHYVSYEGSVDDGPVGQWLAASPVALKLVSAPVLVSTIDHLMPATEGSRGGKQIAPMLRLLTADLVLDEPDDFSLEDLPALCRLVNWAGMLGSRVLLSSATLPPALISALFDAYRSGRALFRQNCCDTATPDQICCYWADEYDVTQQDITTRESYEQAHQQWVTRRIRKLENQDRHLRQAELLSVSPEQKQGRDLPQYLAEVLRNSLSALHRRHHQVHPQSGQCVSIGLLRFANIDPMIAIARRMLEQAAPLDEHWHFCVYHSQYPLAMRSAIEAGLDRVLTRHDEDSLWQQPAITEALRSSTAKHHIFIVFGTPVTEVGRDHDYDWAIAEPSSMRSLIQLAGRVQRHRQKVPATPNILILSRNYKALSGKSPAYQKPGFESAAFPLREKDLQHILTPEQYRYISAIPRLSERPEPHPDSNLADLEHASLKKMLDGPLDAKQSPYAALWWQHAASWCAVLQRKQPFRYSPGQQERIFVLHAQDEDEDLRFCEIEVGHEPLDRDKSEFKRVKFVPAERISAWIDNEPKSLLMNLAEQLDLSLPATCLRFGEVRITRNTEWGHLHYHDMLGIYGAID